MHHSGHRFVKYSLSFKVIVEGYRTPNRYTSIKGVISRRIGESTYIANIPELDLLLSLKF